MTSKQVRQAVLDSVEKALDKEFLQRIEDALHARDRVQLFRVANTEFQLRIPTHEGSHYVGIKVTYQY